MKRVTGIGGIFFKAQDPKAMKDWYRTHLGVDAGDYGASFHWREADDPEKRGETVWTVFPHDTKYFDPGTSPFMINYRVEDLHALVAVLREEGVTVEKVDDSDYGRFAWISDPEGNRIELWEPPAPTTDDPPKV
jgi:catechol 2,3-dioxygenase-like lactoylglutathione lyase family enzyme